MNKFIKEFKEFIARGNVIDLAVAVIIGGAFSAIVTALTNKIIMPLINWALAAAGGKDGLASAYTFLSRAYDSEGNLDLTNSIYIDWGAFITAILDFLLIALVLFIIVKAFNASRHHVKKIKSVTKANLNKDLREEKKAVRAQAKAEGKSYRKAWKEHQLAKEETAKVEEAKTQEKAAKEREEMLSKLSTTDRMLYEISEKLDKLGK